VHRGHVSQGSDVVATPGWDTKSRWDRWREPHHTNTNRNAVPSHSPGLAQSAYPGNRVTKNINPDGVASRRRKVISAHPTQPHWGWNDAGVVSQGSDVVATLDFGTESRWDRWMGNWIVRQANRNAVPSHSEGLAQRAYPGGRVTKNINPDGVASRRRTVMQSRWDRWTGGPA
jgi:hypothetical protein